MFETCPDCGCPLTINSRWISHATGMPLELAQCPNCKGRFWHYVGDDWTACHTNIPENRT
jgi:uncharacterized protein with PIN domain